MSKSRFISPLRYPGGKTKMAGVIKDIILENNLVDATYIEPFAGGAGVALYLLKNGFCNRVIINDYDKGIYAFWYSVLNYTEELCELIRNTPVNINEWYRQREIALGDSEQSDLLKLGFSTFYLNRTNVSGIIKAGPIGGYEQKGKYKIDCRFNRGDLTSRIYDIAKYKKKISLYNMDASFFVSRIVSKQKKASFIFFDPPYFEKGKELYSTFYEEKNHKELYNKIRKIYKHKWIVTYDDSIEIKKLYSNIKSRDYNITYSVANTGKASETMYISENLLLPKSLKKKIVKKVENTKK
ncbi:DNA adenine methylase [Clostridium perfringens]